MISYLRYLPPVHAFQHHERFQYILEEHNVSDVCLTEMIQEELATLRHRISRGEWTGEEPTKKIFIEEIFALVERRASKEKDYYLRRVLNGTGTVLHTNLGRARLSKEAIAHVVNVASNYSNLEYHIEAGKRGSRHDIIEKMITKVTGAEAAMVVNNNAAAVYLILRALAKEKEVIVSRGELVEIGGSFRVSSIMEESGAKLKEVGTTNKTHLYDYEQTVGEETAMIMKVHTSNFKVIGFTESVGREELVALCQQKNLIYYEDLGSGDLFGYEGYGIGDEPIVKTIINSKADIVSFSGDKLLGGPQAGIIVGKKEYIAKLKKHQLARVLRVDKMTFAALEATLVGYLKGKTNPTITHITETKDEVKKRAEAFMVEVSNVTESFHLHLQEGVSQVGGGTMPEVELPTYLVAVRHEHKSAERLAEELRQGELAVVGRIKKETYLLDFRTITVEEVPLLVKCFQEIISE